MAGPGKPGPARGKGGAPRKGTATKPDPMGYRRMTTGSKANPKLRYVQDVVAGLSSPGKKGLVVDHKSGHRADDRPSNLRITTRSVNRLNQHPKLTPHPRSKK